MDKPLSQERLNEKLESLRNVLTEDGPFKPYNMSHQFSVQASFLLEMLDEVKRLQAIEAERDRYEDALQEILWYPQGNALVHVQAIKKIADNSLKGVNDNESN